MKIETKIAENGEFITSLQEIFCDTVLETEEGNKIAVCMRDDTVELSVVGSDKWYRADMQTGEIKEM